MRLRGIKAIFPSAKPHPSMTMLRTLPAVSVLFSALFLSPGVLRAALPDYKLGDTAIEDVITPVPLLVVNPDATEVLKQKVAQQVPTIVRRTEPSTAEAEAELRTTVNDTRMAYLAACKQMLASRTSDSGVVDADPFTAVTRDFARTAPKNFPLARFSGVWLGGHGDESLVESLLQPLREVMAQPIVADLTDTPLSANAPVRLIPVQTAIDVPSMQELEATSEATISPGKVISLWRARRLVETHFPAGQQEMGRFAAGFVRANAFPAPGLTEILRARRLTGVTVNDSYEAAQIIVKKGQVIDRKALNAMAAVREKSLIGTLQTKLEQEQTIASQITRQTKWMAAGLGAMCLVLVLIFWRLRSRPDNALVPVTGGYQNLPGGDQHALPGEAADGDWKNRAMAAEMKAARAQEAIRTGALGWMKDKVFQSALDQRAELLSAQQRAEAEMRELEQRLEQLHTPLQERIKAYEKRIEELEQDLAAKGEENRELIGARITVAKQQLNVERGRFGIN